MRQATAFFILHCTMRRRASHIDNVARRAAIAARCYNDSERKICDGTRGRSGSGARSSKGNAHRRGNP
jgi:hypothetical protein